MSEGGCPYTKSRRSLITATKSATFDSVSKNCSEGFIVPTGRKKKGLHSLFHHDACCRGREQTKQ